MKLLLSVLPGISFTLFFPAFFVYATANNPGNPEPEKTINIGFIIPMPTDKDDLSREAVYGAQLAIEEANDKNGFLDIPFKMVIRSADGPWGAGSKRAVSLVYEDEVSAIVTSLDGRNAHLAEQVITKAQVALIVTRATDPTITKAYVPWVFRILPNDEQQAEVLANEIYQKRKFRHVLVLTSNTYDSKGGATAFFKTVQVENHPIPQQILFETGNDMKRLAETVQNAKTDAIVIFGLPHESTSLIKQLHVKHINIPVFGSVSSLFDNTLIHELKNTESEILIISPGFLQTENGLAFQTSFKKKYGFMPGAVAANAYEGIKLMIHAIMNAGPDRDAIRDFFLHINNYQGINGTINFDDNGNLKTEPCLMNIGIIE